MIGHKGQGNCAWKGDRRGELSGQEEYGWNAKDPKYERDDANVPFGFGKREKIVGHHKKKRGLEIRGVLCVESNLAPQIIAGVSQRIDFIQPERFLVKVVVS